MDKVGVVKETPYQFVGVESSQGKSFSGSGRRHCPSPSRLSGCRRLHPQSRRNQELSLVKRSSSPLERSSVKKGHFVDPALAQHQGQQHGRLPQPQQDDAVGVHVVEVGVQTCPGDIGGVPDDGRVREQRHAPAAPLHVLVSGQQGHCTGCNDSSLGPRQLPVPALPDDHEVSPEDQSREDQGSHDHPSVAVLPVVASGSGDVGGASSTTPILQGHLIDSEGGACVTISGTPSGGAYFGEQFSKSNSDTGLDDEDLTFLSNHLSAGTKKGYVLN